MAIVTKRAWAFCRKSWFPLVWSFIGLVSAIDSYFVVRFRELLPDLEENPVGRYLLELQNGHIGILLRAKAAGTIAVLSVLAGLYIYRHRWAAPIAGSIASFQMGLLFYLTMSLPACSAPAKSVSQLLSECTFAVGVADRIKTRPNLVGRVPVDAHRSAPLESDTP